MGKMCLVEDCHSPRLSLGYCKKHYLRNRKYGSPTAGRCFDGVQMAFLQSLVGATEPNCILWPYGKQKNGYGIIRDGTTSRPAHRVMCRMASGQAPSRHHQAAHSCHNKLCVNPNHLRWATPHENTQDRVRANRCAKGERQHLARLTAEQVAHIRRSELPTTALAAQLSVSKSTIERVRNKTTWAHVE